MDGFEKNKIVMAVLLALLIGMVAGKVGDVVVNPKPLEKLAITIDNVEETATSEGPEAPDIVEPLEPLLAKASIENGEKISKRCLQCHSFEKGGPNKVGPNLYGVVGGKMAHMDSFSYSSALKGKQDTWTLAHLNNFLHKPSTYIPGTKMAFIGLKKAQERADIIVFLNKNSDKPLIFAAS